MDAGIIARVIRTNNFAPVLFALLIALRAVVPVGYMLVVPTEPGSFGLSLALCPMQNSALDLNQLGALDSRYEHRHLHAPDSAVADGGSSSGYSDDCGTWLSSTLFALDFDIPRLETMGSVRLDPSVVPDRHPVELPRGRPQPRAPPA